MAVIERGCWLILALIHMLPSAAVFAPSLISRLYGVDAGGDLYALLQHRAVLFGCIVIAALWAAFDTDVRRLATVMLGLSMLGFLAIYALQGAPGSLRSIAIADGIGLPFLAYAGFRAFTFNVAV